jgi:hypothetical protein
MRALFSVLTAWLALSAPVAAQREVNDRFWVARDGYIRLFNQAGTIRVRGWDKDTLAITGTINVPPGGEYVSSPGKQGAKVSVWGPNNVGAKGSDLVIYVPRGSQVWIKTLDARVAVSDFVGGLDVVTVTGSIEVSGAPREVYVESMGGEVNLAVSTRSARVKTASGKVTLRGAIEDATVSTVSGPVFAIDTRVRQGRFESVDGDIQYVGDPIGPSALEFINHAGDVELALSPKAAASFAVRMVEGVFRDEYGLRVKQGVGKLKGKELSFSIGPATDAEVNIVNFKGAVVVKKLGYVKKAE